jgi:predicted ArsR family transcriptional regulator
MTTIQVDEKVVKLLKKLKVHSRQSYNEVIENMVDALVKSKGKNQYDEFLHKIQQSKMNELWNNSEDEEWEHA